MSPVLPVIHAADRPITLDKNTIILQLKARVSVPIQVSWSRRVQSTDTEPTFTVSSNSDASESGKGKHRESSTCCSHRVRSRFIEVNSKATPSCSTNDRHMHIVRPTAQRRYRNIPLTTASSANRRMAHRPKHHTRPYHNQLRRLGKKALAPRNTPCTARILKRRPQHHRSRQTIDSGACNAVPLKSNLLHTFRAKPNCPRGSASYLFPSPIK